ncbi:response regulator transcription factor [Ostreiculturibacter nitratireducens]|uniref:response regulator transcription factor n=1 Tax=Ostreiculturibacter nitratireducens TaxID=3075226 RepID=UPI0031B5E619
MVGHVLLIEDEPNIIEAIRFILSRDGWQVSVCCEGDGAIAAVRAGRPDVVILDVMLPGRSGFEILADLKADSDLSATRVLMLTAKGQVKEREAAERAGADRFMTKPFANAEFLAAVRALGGAA